ncbi:shikimate dehydrogenase [Nocardioides sp. CER19]|uniref:shikimate dehydrogenase n=1 Tax=Nocardioides sp. CER19 TaxID=3038538 RepID=UPI00244AC324|nr:shikimate dehydrogenase [Nocardioides sp. CER19]MDH2416429.1 shikimate dehydrogenase [Nocardioides sp. CER19]
MRCAVLGDPVAHSLSPELHAAGYAAVGLEDWSYDAVRVPSGSLAGFAADLDATWRGLSITAPLKREALAFASPVTDRALLAGGVNTLVRSESGWAGDNTDLPGAMSAIRERYAGPIRSAVILGGGATAASVGLALAELGASSLTLAVREPSRAAATVAALVASPTAPVVDAVPLDAVGGSADVVVSTIPVSAQTPELVARCAGAPVVFEVTYNTWPTPLSAAATGVVVSGLDLLVHQAVLQFEQFTGVPAPLDAMRLAGEAALAARSGD